MPSEHATQHQALVAGFTLAITRKQEVSKGEVVSISILSEPLVITGSDQKQLFHNVSMKQNSQTF